MAEVYVLLSAILVSTLFGLTTKICNNKLCAWRHDMPPPLSLPPVGAVTPRAAEPTAAPADGNVAAVSHAQYVPMTADRCSCLCVNAAVSKPAW